MDPTNLLKILDVAVATAVLGAWVWSLRKRLQRWQRWYREDLTQMLEEMESQMQSQERQQEQVEQLISDNE